MEESKGREVGGGVKHTFGKSQAALNLVGDILEKPEHKEFRPKVFRLLSKQSEFLNSVMEISNKRVREACLKMSHDRFATSVAELPEIVRTHVLCVETGVYRQLVAKSRKEEK